MAETHHVYLIPGFFGFSHLGSVNYFGHVRRTLEATFRERGIGVAIHHVRTLPTSSLSRRVARLLDEVAGTAGDDEGPIHLIGHSTGGIDARLLVRPHTAIASPHRKEDYASRVRTVVTVATPHQGTPLAGFFTSVLGQKLLRLLSLSTIHVVRLKSLPRPGLVLLAAAAAATSKVGLLGTGLLDTVYRQILRDFSEERREQLIAFFEEVGSDQTLLPQLAPEAMELLNMGAVRRRGVRYGSVVTQARRPRLDWQRARLRDTVLWYTYPVYSILHRLVSRLPEWAAPELTKAQSEALAAAYGREPSVAANDAIVPTLSQVRGDVVHAAWADHLDVLGWFDGGARNGDHIDWLRTLSGYRRRHFEATWSDVVDYLLGSSD